MWLALVLSIALAPRAALPGALPPRPTVEAPSAIRFTSVTHEHELVCHEPGRLCFLPAPGATLRASVLWGTSAGKIPIFFRAPTARNGPWDLLLVANLKQRNLKGTVMIVVYDQEDRAAQANHEVTAMWQAEMDPFRMFALWLHVDPDESSISHGHAYLFQVVQLVKNREVVLAQGNVRFE